MLPSLQKGGSHTDARGALRFNNEFDAKEIKRIYVIENADTKILRRWQGHKVEQRWFSAIQGSFKIELIAIDDWERPSKGLACVAFELQAGSLDILHVPSGYVSSIQMLEMGSKLLVMADYRVGELNDEVRYEGEYFEG